MSDDVLKQLERAYKKLKASIYFDKTQLVLRNKIIEYEGKYNSYVEERLKNMTKLLSGEDNYEWKLYEDDILNSIKALTFPKNVKIDKGETIIINDYADKVDIEDKQYFFDIAVEGQILGVLWILFLGINIDNNLYDCSYGNRLKKKLCDEDSGLASFSPYLFKPYYEQYESWRDIGLKHAQEIMKKNQNVLILTMDFKKFFYSVHFSKEIFDKFYTDYVSEKGDCVYVKRINDFVFNVLKTYSSYFNESNEFENRIFLPIGFLPSNILSNWFLDDFDNEIIKKWNPTYYGRYVDDIIIVEKIEKNSPVFKIIYEEDSCSKKNKIIEYFLCKCRNNPSNNCNNNISILEGPTEIEENNEKKIEYKVNPNIFINHKYTDTIRPNIKLKDGKVKLFYFNYKASNALITCFRKEISKNKSEFRLMPEDGEVFIDDDYSEIYDVKYSDTINKLRGVEGTSIDKFSFSKFLGKYLRIGTLINDKKESKFIKDIEKIFDKKTVIENFITWEKVLNYLVINEKVNSFVDFVKTINKAVKAINFIEVNNHSNIVSISDSLNMFMFSAITRALSHCWGANIKKGILDIKDLLSNIHGVDFNVNDKNDYYKKLTWYRFNYCKTRMCDKYILPLLIDTLFDDNEEKIFNDEFAMNLGQLSTFMKNSCNMDLGKIDYKYFPYMITPQDISMSLTCNKLKSIEDICDNEEKIDIISTKYIKMNYNYGEKEHENYFSDNIICKPFKEFTTSANHESGKYSEIKSHIIKVGNNKKKKFRIAVANVSLKNDNFIGVLTDTPNRSFERYNNLSKIINIAIKKDADILVLPEAHVPFEWISTLARISSKSKMAIITGVEHVKVVDDKALTKKDMRYIYNLTATILPYTSDDYIYTHVSFHTKVFYSPEEQRQIKGYGFQPKKGSSYDLFNWNDLWFSTYCCYELASIKDRCRFLSYVDLLAIVEWNPDINYYSNIIESLSRDMHCYCVQVNSSDYGDSRIAQPSKTEHKDILKVKGGINETVLIGEVDIDKLRHFQIKDYELQKDDNSFKPTPPEFSRDIVDSRIKGKLFYEL
jgi:hypothetical protein